MLTGNVADGINCNCYITSHQVQGREEKRKIWTLKRFLRQNTVPEENHLNCVP